MSTLRMMFRAASAGCLLGVCAVGCGCAGGDGRDDLGAFEAEAGGVFGDPALTRRRDADGGPTAVDLATPTNWTIMVARVQEGRDPERTRSNVEGTLDLPVAIEMRRGGSFITYGSYTGPEDPRAAADLARIKATRVGEVPVFRQAALIPPDARVVGSRPEWDLGTVRDRFGEDAIYTLQIGVYGRGDNRTPAPAELVEFRRLAEEAVSRLRIDGDQAFYNHGPFMSTVTVGVLGQADHDPSVMPPMESDVLRLMRRKHPFNLLNGQAIKERFRAGGRVTERLQPSMLVAIPD